MNALITYLRELTRAAVEGWNRFFFAPSDPATVGLVRLLAGSMMFYTHLVWTLALDDFFGTHAWVTPASAADGVGLQSRFAWSYFWDVPSSGALWMLHIATLVIMAMYALGLFTRVTTGLSWLAAIAYANRTPGALFGLDQINTMLAMYLTLAPAGEAFSLDRWLKAHRAGGLLPKSQPSVSANLAARLIQLHMCVIYFFAGLSKLQGNTWWDGSALWWGFANYEYQSLDMTWMAGAPLLVAMLTTITVYWELSFCVLVWPRILRPLVLFMAIPLHLGIGVCLGMMTFGLVMLIALVSFIPPDVVRATFTRTSK